MHQHPKFKESKGLFCTHFHCDPPVFQDAVLFRLTGKVENKHPISSVYILTHHQDPRVLTMRTQLGKMPVGVILLLEQEEEQKKIETTKHESKSIT